jgi:hypothetical protein
VHCIQLQASHNDDGTEATWHKLYVTAVSLASLACLPLHRIRQMTLQTLRAHTSGLSGVGEGGGAGVSAAAAALVAARAAAQDCKFTCHMVIGVLQFPVSDVPALLPLLASWQGIHCLALETWSADQRLTPAAVHALGAMLEQASTCKLLRLNGYLPLAGAPLLPALHRSSVECVNLGHRGVTDVELAWWCAWRDTCRPINLSVDAHSNHGRAASCRVGNVDYWFGSSGSDASDDEMVDDDDERCTAGRWVEELVT